MFCFFRKYTWFFEEINCTVVIPFKCLKKIFKYAKKNIPNEIGGTLVGKYSSDGKTAFIEGVLVAKQVEKQGLTFFVRPSDKKDKSLETVYKKSKGNIHYVGEWHTHPYSQPKPSSQDESTLIDLVKQNSVKTDKPIMIIVGNNFSSIKDICCTLGLNDKVILGRFCEK